MNIHTDLSMNLFIDCEASIEGLRRAQLLSDVLIVPSTEIEPADKEFELELKHMTSNSRINFISDVDVAYISDVSLDDPIYSERIMCYLAEAMCRAFASGKVTSEWSETGHRIRWAYDDGSEEFPTMPLTQGFGFIGHRRSITSLSAKIDDFIEKNKQFGASYMEGKYVESAILGMGSQWMLLQRTMDRLSQKFANCPRLGLVAEHGATVKWTRKVLNENIVFNARDIDNVGKLLRVALPASSHDVKLSNIEASEFYDLCAAMKEPRDQFSRKLSGWCDALDKLDPKDHTDALRKIRNEEVIPEIQQFNSNIGSTWKRLKNIGGGDIATISIGALTAAGVWSTGHSPIISGISALPTTVKVVGDAIKREFETRKANRRHWVAFAAKLNETILYSR